MANDDRNVLELLKAELDFVQKGGYGPSAQTPLTRTSIFQDSQICLNYGYPYRAHSCNECHLMNFVSPALQGAAIPCHHISLNEAGETIAGLESADNQARLARNLEDWLRQKISELEQDAETRAMAECP